MYNIKYTYNCICICGPVAARASQYYLSLPLPALGSLFLLLSPYFSANILLLLLLCLLLFFFVPFCLPFPPLLPAATCCCLVLPAAVARCCCTPAAAAAQQLLILVLLPIAARCLYRLREWTLYSTSPSPLCRPQVLFCCCFLFLFFCLFFPSRFCFYSKYLEINSFFFCSFPSCLQDLLGLNAIFAWLTAKVAS